VSRSAATCTETDGIHLGVSPALPSRPTRHVGANGRTLAHRRRLALSGRQGANIQHAPIT
jgi:hypothetical protein